MGVGGGAAGPRRPRAAWGAPGHACKVTLRGAAATSEGFFGEERVFFVCVLCCVFAVQSGALSKSFELEVVGRAAVLTANLRRGEKVGGPGLFGLVRVEWSLLASNLGS